MKNVVSLFYSKGAQSIARVSAEDLVEAALRMGMDGILMQELRDEAAYAYLSALESGHWGMTTTHADTASQVRDRIRGLVKKHPAGRALSDIDVMASLRRSIDVIVHYPFTFVSPETPADDPTDLAIAAAIAAPTISTPSPQRAPSSPSQPSQPTEIAPTPTPAIEAPAPLVVPVVGHHEPTPVLPTSADPAFGPRIEALTGKLAAVTRLIAKHDAKGAQGLAQAWRDDQPADVLALIGLGEAFEATGDLHAAARAYGSLIDLYPAQADYRRFAGERLERVGAIGRTLAIDTYRRAAADRPDQVTGHRLLAYALLRNNDYAGAFKAILAAVDQPGIDGRYLGAKDVFARDAGMIATAYIAHGGDPDRVAKQLAKRDLEAVTERSLRVILYWETDVNDVDLHVLDAHGGHAWYAHKDLESGGALYADITTGFGPECFEIRGDATAGPYELGVHYYAEGPMGYGMGLMQIVRFDGKSFTFDDRPYMIMKNKAYVSLGRIR